MLMQEDVCRKDGELVVEEDVCRKDGGLVVEGGGFI